MPVRKRLTRTEAARLKARLVKEQCGRCAVCQTALDNGYHTVLDHDHQGGFVRGVLCRTCNTAEGKIMSRAVRYLGGRENALRNLRQLVLYLENAERDPWRHSQRYHPAHKTQAEKRAAYNAKRRAKRAAAKEGGKGGV